MVRRSTFRLAACLAAAALAAVPASAEAAYRAFRSPTGKLGCTSRWIGITCRSLRSEHGFTVSVERQRTF